VILLSESSSIGFDFHKTIRIIAFVFHKNKFVLLAPRCAACGDLWTRKTPHAVFVYRYKTLEINKIYMQFCCTQWSRGVVREK
jgi:hypothetical protein